MALKLDITMDDTGLILTDAHAVIEYVNSKLDDTGFQCSVSVNCYTSKTDYDNGKKNVCNHKYDLASQPITMADAYIQLKTLDKFLAATDV